MLSVTGLLLVPLKLKDFVAIICLIYVPAKSYLETLELQFSIPLSINKDTVGEKEFSFTIQGSSSWYKN